MTLWEFHVAIEAWNKAQGGDTGVQAPTAEEHEERVRRLAGLH